jgi:hypothetical protein
VATVTVDDGKDDEQDEWDLALVTNAHNVFFSKYDVLLDNEASINIISNRNLLTGVRAAEKKVMVGGIQRGASGVKVTEQGEFRDVGNVYVNDSATANVLSFASQIDAGADITYDTGRGRFIMRPSGCETAYYFGRKEISGSEGQFYICDTRTMIHSQEAALVQTVEENMKSNTKREVEQARKAIEMLVRMGFPSVPQAIRAAGSGGNFDVTARDFEIEEAIWGKDVASLKGKTKKKATLAADIEVTPTLVQQEQVLSVDIMFIQKLAVLIGVATPLDLTLETSLSSLDLLRPSRAAVIVKKGLQYFLGVLSSQNFKTRLIMTDGEGALAKLKSELNALGIEVDVSGAGGHVARVERRIQVVKERVRTHTHHLPFTPSLLVLLLLILYCVSRLNNEPSSVRGWTASPRELFTGRKAGLQMRAADGITTTSTHTGVSTNSIRDFDHAPSHLPTMITPPSLTDEDPDMTLRDGPAAGFELQLADDAGMDQHNGTVERGEAGGVPSANFQDQTADPTHSGELEGHVAGDHGGASQDTGDTGSAGRDSGGDMGGEPYEIGGASDENRGADGDIGGDESESAERPESEPHQGNIPTGRPEGLTSHSWGESHYNRWESHMGACTAISREGKKQSGS